MLHIPDSYTATEEQLFALFATIVERIELEPYERLLGRALIDFRDPTIRAMISVAQLDQERMTCYVFGLRVSVVRPASGSEERLEYRYYAFYSDGVVEVFNSVSNHYAIESIHTWEDGIESMLYEVDRAIVALFVHTAQCKKRLDRFVKTSLNQVQQETTMER